MRSPHPSGTSSRDPQSHPQALFTMTHPLNTAFIVFAYISVVCLLLPAPLHIKARNTGETVRTATCLNFSLLLSILFCVPAIFRHSIGKFAKSVCAGSKAEAGFFPVR